eukprot:Gb_35224 [translate_table: standard]
MLRSTVRNLFLTSQYDDEYVYIRSKRVSAIGLWQKEAKILFLGLDNAGKTTLLHRLKNERLVQHEPTRHPISEELSIGKIKFKAFDLGGHQVARRVWKDYYAKLVFVIVMNCSLMDDCADPDFDQVDGIVYVVDAVDRGRFAESRRELDAILTDDSLADVPILVLGNKIDIPTAAPKDEVEYRLGLTMAEAISVRPIKVFMCSVVRQMGYGEGIKWLSDHIK